MRVCVYMYMQICRYAYSICRYADIHAHNVCVRTMPCHAMPCHAMPCPVLQCAGLDGTHCTARHGLASHGTVPHGTVLHCTVYCTRYAGVARRVGSSGGWRVDVVSMSCLAVSVCCGRPRGLVRVCASGLVFVGFCGVWLGCGEAWLLLCCFAALRLLGWMGWLGNGWMGGSGGGVVDRVSLNNTVWLFGPVLMKMD
jgi:hypothetical protein